MPTSNYKDKYVHLIGQDAALEAAKKTQSNKSYGFGKQHFYNTYNIVCYMISIRFI